MIERIDCPTVNRSSFTLFYTELSLYPIPATLYNDLRYQTNYTDR